MSKDECLAKLQYLRETFFFSLGAYGLATKSPTSSVLAQYKIELVADQIYVLAENEESPKHWLKYAIGFESSLTSGAARAFVRQTFLMMILESFEAVKKYAAANELLELFMSQEWYSFARHLRNAIGHNGIWCMGKKSKDLPCTFRNKTIDVSLDGLPIGDFIDWVFGLQLHATITNWVYLDTDVN